MLTIILLAIVEEGIIQLGLAGAAMTILSTLLVKQRKDNKELSAQMLEEINKRDERYVAMIEKTSVALHTSSEVIANAASIIEDFYKNEKKD